MKVVLIECVC